MRAHLLLLLGVASAHADPVALRARVIEQLALKAGALESVTQLDRADLGRFVDETRRQVQALAAEPVVAPIQQRLAALAERPPMPPVDTHALGRVGPGQPTADELRRVAELIAKLDLGAAPGGSPAQGVEHYNRAMLANARKRLDAALRGVRFEPAPSDASVVVAAPEKTRGVVLQRAPAIQRPAQAAVPMPRPRPAPIKREGATDTTRPISNYVPGQAMRFDRSFKLDQHLLKALGYDVGRVDGLHGPKSCAAVRAFKASIAASQPHQRAFADDCALTESARATLRMKAHVRGVEWPAWAPYGGRPGAGRPLRARTGAVTVNENGDNPVESQLEDARRWGNVHNADKTALAYRSGEGRRRYLNPQTVAFGTVHMDARYRPVSLGTLGVFSDPSTGRRTVVVAGDTGRTNMEVSIAGHKQLGLSGDNRSGTCARCTIQWYAGTAKPGGYEDESDLKAWMAAWQRRLDSHQP